MSREDRMAKMKSIREDTDAKVNGILNDDRRKQKYAEMQQKARERMQQRGGGNSGGAPHKISKTKSVRPFPRGAGG